MSLVQMMAWTMDALTNLGVHLVGRLAYLTQKDGQKADHWAYSILKDSSTADYLV